MTKPCQKDGSMPSRQKGASHTQEMLDIRFHIAMLISTHFPDKILLTEQDKRFVILTIFLKLWPF